KAYIITNTEHALLHIPSCDTRVALLRFYFAEIRVIEIITPPHLPIRAGNNHCCIRGYRRTRQSPDALSTFGLVCNSKDSRHIQAVASWTFQDQFIAPVSTTTVAWQIATDNRTILQNNRVTTTGQENRTTCHSILSINKPSRPTNPRTTTRYRASVIYSGITRGQYTGPTITAVASKSTGIETILSLTTGKHPAVHNCEPRAAHCRTATTSITPVAPAGSTRTATGSPRHHPGIGKTEICATYTSTAHASTTTATPRSRRCSPRTACATDN